MKVIQLLAYSQHLRHSYLEAFSKLDWDEFVKDRGASFGSIRDVFLHGVEVYNFLVNHLIQGDAKRPGFDFEAFGSFEKIRAYVDRVEAEADRYLSRITPAEMERTVERTFSDGTVLQLTVEDMLIHFFQEETHHRGEFIALMWQMGIEPPHLGWVRYINREKAS